jgi:hypothetical protein
MVLVSKLRGASSAHQSGHFSSFFSKIRSTFGRSTSSTSLQAANFQQSPVAAKIKQLRVDAEDADQEDINGADAFCCVEKFDERSTTSGSSAGKHSESPEESTWHIEHIVSLDDFHAQDIAAKPNRQLRTSKNAPVEARMTPLPPRSICGTGDEQPTHADRHSPEPEAEVISPGLVARREFVPVELDNAADAMPGETIGVDEIASTLIGPPVNPIEVPSRLWDPSDPPAQASPAWQLKRDKEALSQQGGRSRFPARLPPLSGLSAKSLRLLSGSTPVVEVGTSWPQSPSGD